MGKEGVLAVESRIQREYHLTYLAQSARRSLASQDIVVRRHPRE